MLTLLLARLPTCVCVCLSSMLICSSIYSEEAGPSRMCVNWDSQSFSCLFPSLDWAWSGSSSAHIVFGILLLFFCLLHAAGSAILLLISSPKPKKRGR